jgi:hypothetical protein
VIAERPADGGVGASDIRRLEADALVITPDTTPDACAEILVKLTGFMAVAKAAEKEIKRRLVEYCEETGRNIPAGDGSYFYPSYRKETSCTDVAATFDALLEHADLDALRACLASQAFKHGACRAHLPDEVYAGLFVEEVKATLKDGGKAEKVLTHVDPKFLKGRK